MTKQKPVVQVDVPALAREVVPLLVPALVEALTRAVVSGKRQSEVPSPPPTPPRRFWTAKEAAEWDAAPDHRIVWDEQGNVVGLHKQIPGIHYWDVVGWDEQRSKAWVQLMPDVKWEPEHSLFHLLESDGKQPDPQADPDRFRRWQEWRVRHPATEHGPIYPWIRRRRRRRNA